MSEVASLWKNCSTMGIGRTCCWYEFQIQNQDEYNFFIFLSPHNMARNLVQLLLKFTPGLDWGLTKAKVSGKPFLVWSILGTISPQCIHSKPLISAVTHRWCFRAFVTGWPPSAWDQPSKAHYTAALSEGWLVTCSDVSHNEDMSPEVLPGHSNCCFWLSLTSNLSF